MPMPTQIKLLRVLENGEITRVGSNEPIKVDVRILSATNRNLEDAVEAGTFRGDLYHRLKVVTLRIPSLTSPTASTVRLESAASRTATSADGLIGGDWASRTT